MPDFLPLLQGRWKQVGFVEDGHESPVDTYGHETCLVISDNNFDVFSSQGELVLKGTFILSSEGYSKSIDWTDSIGDDAGKTFPAIFELSDKQFSFCAADEGMDRPSEFINKKGHTIRRFVKLPQAS